MASTKADVGTDRKRVALGLSENLDNFAQEHNALTWEQIVPVEEANNWRYYIEKAINDPEVEIYFNLDGINNVWASIQKVARGAGGATDWELFKIYSNKGIWDTVVWFLEGEETANPFI